MGSSSSPGPSLARWRPGTRATWAFRSSQGGALARWPADKGPDGGVTVWHVADKDTEWFSPSSASFMINYRVDPDGNNVELWEPIS